MWDTMVLEIENYYVQILNHFGSSKSFAQSHSILQSSEPNATRIEWNRCLDCVHRMPLHHPSPITVAPIGATVHRYPLHRIPLPPPLPSRFLLSPAKWMGTLPRSPPPRPVASQRSARDRNTPWSDLQAIQPRAQRRQRR
jgi:hypothetical protein